LSQPEDLAGEIRDFVSILLQVRIQLLAKIGSPDKGNNCDDAKHNEEKFHIASFQATQTTSTLEQKYSLHCNQFGS
jgi:hypothetical protein